MQKRVRIFGETLVKLIGNKDIENVLKPINATNILKKILVYNQKGRQPTYSMIARELAISPSTVVRNIVRFNTVYLVVTEGSGKEYIIRLTDEGRRIARLLENSESIEAMEEDRKNTEKLIKANKELLKNTRPSVKYNEILLKDFEEREKSLEQEIEALPKDKGFDSKIKIRELQQRLLPVENEISYLKRYINEKKAMIESLKGENHSLQRKLDEFLLKKNW